jgi:hypothetical protein
VFLPDNRPDITPISKGFSRQSGSNHAPHSPQIMPVDFVKALLNHNDKGVAGIYARWHMFEEKREAVMAPGIIERVSLWTRQPIANGHAGAAGLFD